MEGQDHSELITADKSRVQVWDLDQSSVKREIYTESLVRESDEADGLNECMVVKRDPHD